MYPEAEPYYDRAIVLAPDDAEAYSGKAYLYVHWRGSLDEARQALAEADGRVSPSELVDAWAHVEGMARQYKEILQRVDSVAGFADTYLLKPWIFALMNQTDSAHAYSDSVRSFLKREQDEFAEEALFHSMLGWAYAGLGRSERALDEAKKASEMLPISRDAYEGADILWYSVETYVLSGEYETAINEIEYLLSIPSYMTISWLRLDPTWDPLRDHPRFQALLEKYHQPDN